MHRIEFPCHYRYPSDLAGIQLPATLESGGMKVETVAFLDTGASFCLFQRDLGELLGLDLDAGDRRTLSTVAGRFEAVGHPVTLTVLEVVLDSTVYFFADGTIQKNFLGRNGWLNRIRLGLVDYDQRLYLASYDA